MKGAYIRSRSGSALLIVLGLSAFLTVSAVAFATYMRYNRLPSSYLRRTSSSRLLVKAALAQAIEQVDAAIGENPYPGVGTLSSEAERFPEDAEDKNRNFWNGRVFTPPARGEKANNAADALIDATNTTSTLCLEALAYLPPFMINEARYYSRRTSTATWETLGYDAGRYAYCAIDVSDLIDINRVRCAIKDGDDDLYGRNSSDNGRVSLCYLFENDEHTDYGDIKPERFNQEIFTKVVDRSDSVPLTSLADYNLVVNKNGSWVSSQTASLSPFFRYLKGGDFVTDVESDEMVKNSVFVTDSYYVPTNAPVGGCNLADGRSQPFYNAKKDTLEQNDMTVDQLFQMQIDEKYGFPTRFADQIPEFIQLYDYLDLDSIPSSLAVPTTERVPMVIGVELVQGPSFEVTAHEDPNQIVEIDKENFVRWKTYDLKIAGDAIVSAGFAFPFKYNRGTTPKFKAQAALTVTLVPKLDKDTDDDFAPLRYSDPPSAHVPAALKRADWKTSSSVSDANWSGCNYKSVVVAMSDIQDITISSSGKSDWSKATIEDAKVENVEFTFQNLTANILGELDGNLGITGAHGSPATCTMRCAQLYKQQEDNTKLAVGNPVVQIAAVPSNKDLNGVYCATPCNGTAVNGISFVPVVQVWVRVLDEKNNVVDLVPASAYDDETPSTLLTSENGLCTFGTPLLRFTDNAANHEIVYENNANFEQCGMRCGSANVGAGSFSMDPDGVAPAAYFAYDPRFNHAPESMFTVSSVNGGIWEDWSAQAKANQSDIWMTTSDAGYLQSGTEFLNLVNVTDMDANKMWGTLEDGYDGKRRAMPPSKLAAATSMWNTYQPEDAAMREICEKVCFFGHGFRINPYTTSQQVMMGAIANTPLDWWAAATNTETDVKASMFSSADSAFKYTFSKHSGAQMQIEYDKLEEVAQKIQSIILSGGTDWKTAFDNADWMDGADDALLGVTDLGVNLHEIDRKYLYGFWRDCFEAQRQQLFLIFVRAEPVMLGSGGVNQTPPQLGARAMAVVWRDPTPSGNMLTPHRTRILFYRQFD